MAGDCGFTCPFEGGFYSYDPNVGGNSVLLAAYGILAPVVFFMGYQFGTPMFSATLTTGTLLEILGFIGRLLLHSVPDSQAYFTLSLVGTVLGPTFMSAAIFLILPHILNVYGEQLCPFRPLYAVLAFSSLIVATLVLEVVGVVFVAYEYHGLSRTDGANILIGGLAIQTAVLLGFIGLHFWFTVGLSTRGAAMDPKHATVYLSKRYKRFLMGMELVTVALIACSIYRIIEVAGGVTGTLFQNEAAFTVINGALPLIACVVLTIFHPGAAFGTAWGPTSARRSKRIKAAPRRLHHPTGYAMHHRYDPQIRKQMTPTSQRHLSHSSGPPELPSGSPGLPGNPRPLTSPRIPPPVPGKFVSLSEKRSSDPAEQKRNLVDSDALW